MSSRLLTRAYIEAGRSVSWVATASEMSRLASAPPIEIADRDLTTPPVLSNSGLAYIVAAGATGLWSGSDGRIAADFGDWHLLDPFEGLKVYIADENVMAEHDGSAWCDYTRQGKLGSIGGVTTGITAAVGSAQGDGPLTARSNVIETCATAGDAVTLPSAVAGLEVTIWNRGAESADVFPASGDKINGGETDAAEALAAAAKVTYRAIDSAEWLTV